MCTIGKKIFFLRENGERDEGRYYQFLENVVRGKVGELKTYSVRANKVDGKKTSTCFIKYAYCNDERAVNMLRKESSFIMCYPFIEQIYGSVIGSYEYDEGAFVDVFVVEAEYLKGKNLETRGDEIKNRHKAGTWSDEDEKDMFRQMMQLLYGVQYYYNLTTKDNFVHRDLKPENIIITDEKRAVIVDFDWAHIHGIASSNDNSGIGGTPGYEDPRAEYSHVDIQADIYALGRIFCFWLRGERYFDGKEVWNYYKKGNEELAYGLDEKRLPQRYRKDEYQPFIAIIQKMVNPLDFRYKTIREIIRDMKDFLIAFYGGENNYEEIFGKEDLLRRPENRFVPNQETEIRFSYIVSHSGRERKVTHVIQPYRMHEIKLEERPVMAVYNLDGRLHYIPYSDKLKGETESGDYRIKNEDRFCYEDQEIRFHL